MDDERETIVTRALRLLEETEGISAALEERRRLNSERAGMAGREWQAPEPPEPLPPLRRSAHTPRDWVAESEWIRGLARMETARLKAEIIEGIGRVIAGERAATKKLLDELRNELRLLIAENRLRDADRVIAHLDAVLVYLAEKGDRMVTLDANGEPVRH
jgi:hypothetical protein